MKPASNHSTMGSLFNILAATAITCMWLGSTANAADHPLTVAVSLDIPPYVIDNASRGLEVYLMHRALPNYRMKWVQMDYQSLETAVPDKKADIAMSVQTRQPKVFYSADYIGFANFAISRKADKLSIERVVDLKGHPVLAWENAWKELGDEFNTQYAPGSTERSNYVEVANQAEQVRQFWAGAGKVIVVDRSIFDYFSGQQSHALDEVEYHSIFPKITKFKVAFASAAMRDEFNRRLSQLCDGGEYRRILKLHHMEDLAGVCDAGEVSGTSGSPAKP